MSTNPSGVFTLPASTWVQSGDDVLPEQHNPPFQEVEQALTERLMRDGRAPMSGALRMGGNRITSVGAPTASSDAATKAYVDSRTPAAGDGLTGGNGGALAVDATVLRTNVFQSRTQTLLFTNGALVDMRGPSAAFRGSANSGDTKYQFTKNDGENSLNLRVWTNTFDASATFLFYASAGGVFEAPFLRGDGSQITGLNGTAISSGTVPIARLPSSLVQDTRAVAAGDGLTGGGDLSANRTLAVDGTVVRTTRTVVAGAGMTGGGALSSNQTISMGIPGSITLTSTNSTTATSHTHEISGDTFRAMSAAYFTVGAPGVPMMIRLSPGGSATPGQVVPASAMDGYASTSGDSISGTPAGTWRCHGRASGNSNGDRTTIFVRVN